MVKARTQRSRAIAEIMDGLPAPRAAAGDEHTEQSRFCRWLDTWLLAAGGRYHAVVNEGRRSAGERARASQQGLRKGVPDLYMFHPAVGLIALEFKRADGCASDVRPEQREWLAFIGQAMGERFHAAAVFGCTAAQEHVRALFGARGLALR
jgi:hypothetical protein